MHKKYWGLSDAPFVPASTAATFHDSCAQVEALARINYLIQHNNRLGLLVGEDGLGKTSLFDHVARGLRRRRRPVVSLNVLGMDQQEFILTIAQTLGAIHDLNTSSAVAWRHVFDRFQANQYQQLSTVILVDDAHEAEAEVLTSVARLSQWQPTGRSKVTVVLSAEVDRVELIGSRLLELCELRIDLEPWSQEDTMSYIQKSVLNAGGSRPLFDVRAVETIQKLSGGVPRRIRQLAELSLVAGAGHGLERVDSETVMAVDAELRAPIPV